MYKCRLFFQLDISATSSVNQTSLKVLAMINYSENNNNNNVFGYVLLKVTKTGLFFEYASNTQDSCVK